jgi:hypothetical protein
MSVAKQFIDHLKQENVLEAIQVIKDALDEHARQVVSNVHEEIAESFKLKTVKVLDEKDDEESEDEDDSEDEGKDDEDEDKE